MLKDKATVAFLLLIWALFLGAVVSNYAYRGSVEPGSAIVDFLEANYTEGWIATDLEYVTRRFEAPYVSPYKGAEYNWSLPIFLMEENISYAVVPNNSWIYLQGLENPGLLRPLVRGGDIHLSKTDVGAWEAVRDLVRGRVILSDDPRMNRYAKRAVATWEGARYGWRKEELLSSEGIELVVYYRGEGTAADELFHGEDYLVKEAMVVLDRPVTIYRVDREKLGEWFKG